MSDNKGCCSGKLLNEMKCEEIRHFVIKHEHGRKIKMRGIQEEIKRPRFPLLYKKNDQIVSKYHIFFLANLQSTLQIGQ
jgi:hypothetical protein